MCALNMSAEMSFNFSLASPYCAEKPEIGIIKITINNLTISDKASNAPRSRVFLMNVDGFGRTKGLGSAHYLNFVGLIKRF